jgi:hypothetical protein
MENDLKRYYVIFSSGMYNGSGMDASLWAVDKESAISKIREKYGKDCRVYECESEKDWQNIKPRPFQVIYWPEKGKGEKRLDIMARSSTEIRWWLEEQYGEDCEMMITDVVAAHTPR